MSLLGTLAQGLGTAYDYLTPGLGSSRLTDYGNRVNAPSAPNFATGLGQFAQGAATPAYNPNASINNLNAGNALLASLQKELAGLKSTMLQPAPFYDINKAYSVARQQAEGAINPYYTKTLNQYLADQQLKQQRAQEDYATTNKLLEQSLANTLQENTTSRGRTTEDTANKIAGINEQNQNYQQDTGTAFDAARLEAARQGNVGSGLTQQALNTNTQQANIQENRQARSFDLQKQAEQLFKTRSFEDLARSDVLAQQKTTNAKQAAQTDLDRAIQDLNSATAQYKSDLEYKRLQDIASKEGDYYKLGVQQFINTLSNPYQQQAARTAYGG